MRKNERRAMGIAIIATNQNIHCQPVYCTKTPPRTRPATEIFNACKHVRHSCVKLKYLLFAIAPVLPNIAIARACSWLSGNAWTIR